MIDKCREFFKNKNNLIVVVLVGILLMVIALPVKKREDKTESRNNIENVSQTEINNSGYHMEEDDYAERMERRLEAALSRLEGAGEVKVMITLRASSEVVVEKDSAGSLSETKEEDGEGGSRLVRVEDMQEATVYISDSGQSEPYVIKTLTPQVEGVIVLAEGAGEGNVSMEILDAVRVIFGIEAHRVKVMKLNGTN